MLLKPNDLPPMILGEARNLEFKLGGQVGANTINTFTLESVPAGLTFGAATITGSNVTVKVTAGSVGRYTIVATAALSSVETLIGHVRVCVHEAEDTSGGDYQE